MSDATSPQTQPPASEPPEFPGLEHAEQRPPVESRLPANGQFPCSQCGAKLAFSPTDTVLKCPYCGYEELIPQSEAEVVELDFHEQLQRQTQTKSVAGLQKEVRCASCGAVMLLDAALATESCAFCTSPLTNEPVEAKDLIAPQSLLPFKNTNREARELFRRWIGSLWFAPSDLVRMANAGQIHGIYLPHWTYDSMTITQYSGMRGDDYWETETYWTTDEKGNQVQKTRQVRKTRWTPVRGRVDHWFDDVLVPSTHSLPPKYIRALQPWDLENLVPFEPSYLVGFRTERYQVELEAGFEEAKQIMDQHIRMLCCRDIGGDHQRLNHVATKHMGITFKHLLLPVWHSAYHYHGKLFRIVINARTGEVQGERPISWWKVTLAVLGALAVAGIVALIASVMGR